MKALRIFILLIFKNTGGWAKANLKSKEINILQRGEAQSRWPFRGR